MIQDKDIAQALQKEEERQRSGLEMIASENYVSEEVRYFQGSVFTNKYAEGYPSKRYYGGCENVDVVESLAIERLKKIFQSDHANVQPHSGSQANMAVYFSCLKPQDVILGMDLNHGGHLTHGSPVNFSGKFFQTCFYGVSQKTGRVDYNEVESLARKHKPKLIIAGASAYPRLLDFEKFKAIADEVGSLLMVDMAHISGLVATGLHSSPVPYADFVTSTTHKTLRGPRGGFILCKKDWARKIDSQIFPGIQGGPLPHVIAAKAVAFREASQDSFKTYTQQVVKNAKALAQSLIEKNFTLVTGGTDNHLILIDLTSKNITGKEAENVLERAGVTVNKNTIPGETKSPFVTSGIRIGTPALTTRGMKEPEMKQVVEWIDQVLSSPQDEQLILNVRKQISEFCQGFPLFKI